MKKIPKVLSRHQKKYLEEIFSERQRIQNLIYLTKFLFLLTLIHWVLKSNNFKA